ncbi:MAG: hypothetical protein IJI35_02605, partial [Kiritimatiellae bacterium]|nr:hypothetical protein [Kiritimatiellia bacterium]
RHESRERFDHRSGRKALDQAVFEQWEYRRLGLKNRQSIIYDSQADHEQSVQDSTQCLARS